MDKIQFRTEMRKREETLSLPELETGNVILQKRFLQAEETAAADCIMLYISMGREISTDLLLTELKKNGKKVAVPRCLPGRQMEARIYDAERLIRHKYGMLEPDTECEIIPRDHIDLVLVPGLCFDRECRRMGRGGGFYDRWLGDYHGRTLALCRDSMLCESIPCEQWDLPVDCVLTETREFRRK